MGKILIKYWLNTGHMWVKNWSNVGQLDLTKWSGSNPGWWRGA